MFIPARAGSHGVRLARAVLEHEPQAARGHRVPAAEGAAASDLLGDEQQRYEFFDAKIPQGISTGAAFEQWRRQAEAREPKLLWLSERDIAPATRSSMPRGSPTTCQRVRWWWQLRYRFEPGHEDDGVSALIPLHVLNQLAEEPFEWLVPGLLDEKIEALVRSLPKNLRVHFVPVPEAVAKVMPRLERGRGSLHAQLADALWHTGGVQVPRDAFREELLPPHLRMNFVLIDDAGKVLSRSRSFAALRERHGGAAQQEYARQSELTTGARSWVFGELSEKQDAAPGGTPAGGIPGAGGRRRDRRPAGIRDAARSPRQP
jgi:ATP-dependent helicase HrpA